MKGGCTSKKIEVAIYIVLFIFYSVKKIFISSVFISATRLSVVFRKFELTMWFKYIIHNIRRTRVISKFWYDIELIICSKRSFTGSQLNFSNLFCPLRTLLFNFIQNRMHLFWSISNFNFNLWFELVYQAEQV